MGKQGQAGASRGKHGKAARQGKAAVTTLTSYNADSLPEWQGCRRLDMNEALKAEAWKMFGT